LEAQEDHLEGEIVVSRQTADRVAAEQAWSADDELLLYVIHGMLHLVGFDDHSEADIAAMRDQEKHYLVWMKIPGAESHA
jgi:probable rRNA maturation factor